MAKNQQPKRDDLANFNFDEFTLASVNKKYQQSQNDESGDVRKPLNQRTSRSCSTQTTSNTDAFEMFELSRHQAHYLRDRKVKRFKHCPPPLPVLGASHRSVSDGVANIRATRVEKKKITAVIMSGWLQRRKGLVLKRWKPYYCLLKSDDSLCLYSSEDTVNGKLHQRYQIRRVILMNSYDSFSILGLDMDGMPCKEEYRADMPSEWSRWAHQLDRFVSNTSTFVCRSELVSAPVLRNW